MSIERVPPQTTTSPQRRRGVMPRPAAVHAGKHTAGVREVVATASPPTHAPTKKHTDRSSRPLPILLSHRPQLPATPHPPFPSAATPFPPPLHLLRARQDRNGGRRGRAVGPPPAPASLPIPCGALCQVVAAAKPPCDTATFPRQPLFHPPPPPAQPTVQTAAVAVVLLPLAPWGRWAPPPRHALRAGYQGESSPSAQFASASSVKRRLPSMAPADLRQLPAVATAAAVPAHPARAVSATCRLRASRGPRPCAPPRTPLTLAQAPSSLSAPPPFPFRSPPLSHSPAPPNALQSHLSDHPLHPPPLSVNIMTPPYPSPSSLKIRHDAHHLP